MNPNPGYPAAGGQSAHWFENKLAVLHNLFVRYSKARAMDSRAANADEVGRYTRKQLKAAMDETLEDLARREAVTGCIVCHDGLILAQAGNVLDFEAMAAIAADCFHTAARGADTLALGNASQMVIVGEEHKLVLFRIGAMILGILSPRHAVLSMALRR